MKVARKLYTPDEVAEMSGFHRQVIYRAIRRGELRAFRVCKRIRIKEEDMEEWIERVRERTLLVEQRMAGGLIKRSTKNRQNRTVRLLAPVVQELKELRLWQRRPSEDELVFPGPYGRPWRESTLGQLEEAVPRSGQGCRRHA
jgi:excisionase family DNA binding protein